MFALAEGLGFRFETKALSYNRLRHIPFLRGPRLASLSRSSRRLIKPPWPDIVIGCGYVSVPIVRYIRRQSGGHTKVVLIGNPRTAVADIDLLITTPQYARAPAPNVLALTFPMGDPAAAAAPTATEEQWLAPLPRPRRLIAVGGPARNWRIDRQELRRAIASVVQRSDDDGGTVIVATSPRTDHRTKQMVDRMLGETRHQVVCDFPRFATLLARCDEFHITADSVSMLSEAILTGKPVGMIPIRVSLRGMLTGWLIELGLLSRYLPDFPNFWNELRERKMVGAVERPAMGSAKNSVPIAVDAVLQLLDSRPTR
jgi:mitochondrial fission protein ELM1